jgi:nucleotide-binding universal stress UspA family protein
LPAAADVVVLCVAEVSTQYVAATGGAMMGGPVIESPDTLEAAETTRHQLKTAQGMAARAADRLRGDFPLWRIHEESWVDSAAEAIERKVRAWQPDLVVVGSHGRSGIGRLMLGSVSQHVLHHVHCSVRISRHHLHSQTRAIRILIGVDGSEPARAAARAAAERIWPAGTEARVIGVLDSGIPISAATTLEGAIPVSIEEQSRIRMAAAVHEAVEPLRKAGLTTTHSVFVGKPKEVLLAEAEKWGADSIFVGARGANALERFLLGSVSSAVACHAHCSVEIVQAAVD